MAAPQMSWHIQDVGEVAVYVGENGVNRRGVSISNIGYDLVVTTAEACALAAALLAAAEQATA
jgi:hypothetical protein